MRGAESTGASEDGPRRDVVSEAIEAGLAGIAVGRAAQAELTRLLPVIEAVRLVVEARRLTCERGVLVGAVALVEAGELLEQRYGAYLAHPVFTGPTVRADVAPPSAGRTP